MKHFTLELGRVAVLALFFFWTIGTTLTTAQQTYDPMQAAREAPSAEGAAPAASPNPDFENLPDTPGVEETYYQCVACHSTAIIKQQRISDARWDYLWNWMVEKQGMLEPDAETKRTVLTYLKTHFSSER